MAKPADLPKPSVNAPPPVGGSWSRVYAFVLAILVVDIAVLYALMRVFG